MNDMVISWSFVNNPIVGGKVPLNLFEFKLRRKRLVNKLILSGIVDIRLMLPKFSSRRLGKLPMVGGIVPSVVAVVETIILMTLA